MQPWSALHENLGGWANRYQQLLAKFSEFANLVKTQVAVQTFHVKGIEVALHLNEGYFTTTFLGRTVRYVFSASVSASGSMVGMVHAYRVTTFPEVTATEVNSLTFTPSGQTNLIDPKENDPLNITYDLAAIYITLDTIHSSLTK